MAIWPSGLDELTTSSTPISLGPLETLRQHNQPTIWLISAIIGLISTSGQGGKVSLGQMHAVLIWGHVGLMMAAFGASPLGRLGLRYLLSRIAERQSAQALARGFSGIFLAGGILVTVGVAVGLVLAWDAAVLTRTWVMASIVLITIAGIGNVAVEDRWLKRLSCAEGDAFGAVLHETVPFLAALVSPVIWLFILWLMIEKPA